MLKATCFAIAFAAAVSAAAQTGIVGWNDVAAGEPKKNSCALVTKEEDYESLLKQVGWSGETDFPHIFPPWKDRKLTARIAVVVTAVDHFAQPLPVVPAPNELRPGTSRLTIHLQRDVNNPNSGVLVIVLEPEYRFVRQCDAVYDDDIVASATYPRGGSSSGSSISVNSAKSDDVLVSDGASPSKEVVQKHLVKRINPEYPSDAQKQHIQGPVTLRVEISKEGDVTGAELVSGSPALAQAAINAVKQWKYRPFKVDGEAVEVDAEVQVNFNSKPKSKDDEDDDN